MGGGLLENLFLVKIGRQILIRILLQLELLHRMLTVGVVEILLGVAARFTPWNRYLNPKPRNPKPYTPYTRQHNPRNL